MTKRAKRCETCDHWHDIDRGLKGLCRAHAPDPQAKGPRWTDTGPGEWCGEWAPKGFAGDVNYALIRSDAFEEGRKAERQRWERECEQVTMRSTQTTSEGVFRREAIDEVRTAALGEEAG